jgi:hypothetical protein
MFRVEETCGKQMLLGVHFDPEHGGDMFPQTSVDKHESSSKLQS